MELNILVVSEAEYGNMIPSTEGNVKIRLPTRESEVVVAGDMKLVFGAVFPLERSIGRPVVFTVLSAIGICTGSENSYLSPKATSPLTFSQCLCKCKNNQVMSEFRGIQGQFLCRYSTILALKQVT